MSRALTVALVVTSLAVGGGLSWAANSLSGEDQAPSPRYEEMCDGTPQAFPQAAPRAAAGPRPIYIHNYYQDLGEVARLLKQGPDMNAVPDVAVQLVACLTETDRETKVVNSCRYENGYFYNLVKATYQLSVYDARSGRLLGSAKAVGEGGCDPVTRHVPDRSGETEPEKRPMIPTATRMGDLLAPYVLQ
ncbi:hypothetical protein [Actinomadura sp. 9N407]|uniref:hypothetical protein n=1 Tax=Actinomadura sp. 9N407 TaxID=3375154 RepID=UPI0037BDEAAF